MADDVKVKDAPIKAAGVKVVMNCGGRKYQTSKGVLLAGDSMELPAAEADKMMRYHDIKDAALKVPAQANEIEKLKVENADLRKELSGLKKQIAEKPEKPEKADKPEPKQKDK